MIERPTISEIENRIATIQASRDKWHSDPGYARNLDIELHALKLLLMVTRIENEEINIASKIGGTDG
jgi:hypothetical protein